MDGYNLKRSCWLEISLDNVRDNFFAFKKMVGPDVKVMPQSKQMPMDTESYRAERSWRRAVQITLVWAVSARPLN